MNEIDLNQFEQFISEASGRFLYPATPDIATAVQQKLSTYNRPVIKQPAFSRQRIAWAVVALLILISLVVLTVPPVRAAIFEFFQIGAIRIFVGNAPLEEQMQAPIPPTTIPFPLNLSGETTLAAAREEVNFPLELPTYPAGLGPPDHVFLQEIGVPVVIMAWRDPADPQQIAMSLFIIDNTALPLGTKFEVEKTEHTTVNGQPAFWVSGAHILLFEDTAGRVDMEMTRIVGDHTLIWQADGHTYRLEADLPLAELVKIAESLQEIKTPQ